MTNITPTDTTSFDTILAEFRKQYGHLEAKGLEICCIANLIADHYVISVSHPFIFDRRSLPKSFMGLDVRGGTNENELPKEFQVYDQNSEYIWAYQRFERYVDAHSDLIRRTLGDSTMSRADMLDALCFGNFEELKRDCIRWEQEGTIPKWRE